MTEKEYLDITNLAKLRTARSILLDCLIEGDDYQIHRTLLIDLYEMILRLEDKIYVS